MVKRMVLVPTLMLTESYILENGVRINRMDKGQRFGQMDHSIKVSMKMEQRWEKGKFARNK